MPQAIIPAAIGAVGSIGGALIGSHGAKKAAQATRPMPYSVSGPAGSSSVNGNNINISQADNPWGALAQQLGFNQFGAANGAQNRFLAGANPQVAQAFQGLSGPGMQNEIAKQYGLLTQLSNGQENRDRLGLADSLYARTGLSTSGDVDKMARFEEAANQADLQRRLAATDFAHSNALNTFQAATQGASQGMAAQQQAFNIGNGSFGIQNQLIQQLLQQAGLGVSAGGGQAPEAAMYAAQQSQAPWRAGFNFLQNGGLFQPRTDYGYGGVPMVTQPGGPINVSAPNPSSWMPSGNFGLGG